MLIVRIFDNDDDGFSDGFRDADSADQAKCGSARNRLRGFGSAVAGSGRGAAGLCGEKDAHYCSLWLRILILVSFLWLLLHL